MRIPRYVYALSAIGTGVGVYVLYNTESTEQYLPDEKMNGKTVLVTGGTSGIGKFLTQDLASRGGRVVVGCRDMDKCIRMVGDDIKEPYKTNVVCRHLDLSSLKSIRQFATEFNKNESRLDVLVNNAGVLFKNRNVTQDGFEQTLAVNYLSRFLLTHLLLDKMKKTPGYSRIVNLMCIGYHSGQIDFDDLNNEQFYQTKSVNNTTSLANLLFTYKLSELLEDSDSTVGVYAANPGLADTDLRRDMSTHKAFFSRHILKPVWKSVFQSPKEASKTVLHCILHPHIGHPYSSGKLYYRCQEDRVPSSVYKKATIDRLWDVSVYWTHLPESFFTFNMEDIEGSKKEKEVQSLKKITHGSKKEVVSAVEIDKKKREVKDGSGLINKIQ